MMLANRGSLLSPLFSIELHSSQPLRMVEFYEQTLSLRFKASSYPYPCYMARVGPLALIISEAREDDGTRLSDPGKCTFGILTTGAEVPDGERYFLYPARPLGRAWPKQYAARLRDPDGHYLALASSMEDVMGRVPPVRTLGELLDCAREYCLLVWERFGKRLRHRLDGMVDWQEYVLNRVSFVNRKVGQYTHVVASREGLYVVNAKSYKRILRGSFFGATVKQGSIYCFQACGRGEQMRGRILRLVLNEDAITEVEVIARGLDDGCHQMDFVGEDLLVVDCYNGRIIQISPNENKCMAHYPLGQLTRKAATEVYHMNSVSGHPDGTIWVLLHNHTKKPSEVLVLNRQFEVIRRFSVDAGAAHNIVFTNDPLEYLIADSCGARLMSAKGPVGDVEMMRPRGVSLDNSTCVVGDSFFCDRPFRRYVPGRVHFLDRSSWKCTSSLSVPAAPTEIRRIDGRDLSISNYVATQWRKQGSARESHGFAGESQRSAVSAAD